MSEKQERKIPNLLNNRFDLKALTISTFFEIIDALRSGKVPEITTGSGLKVLCYTSFGTVTGTLLPPSSDESNPAHRNASFIHEAIMEVRNRQIDSFESEGTSQIINDSGYISLVDVEINYYAAPSRTDKLAYFLLYPDQVIGLTFGEHQER